MGKHKFLLGFIIAFLFSSLGYSQEILLNGGFESAASKWKGYCDAAGIAPVDGVGSPSAGLTITASTTSPIAGKSSGLITKDAANRQGCGVASDFIVSNDQKAQVLQIRLSYQVVSGTYTDDQYKVYVYDIDNAKMIEAAPVFIKKTTIIDKFTAVFQTSKTGVNYRLIVHNASTSASASVLRFEASVTAQDRAIGAVATDWKPYSLSITGSSSNPTKGGVVHDEAYWRRVGDTVEIQYDYYHSTAGSGGSGTYIFSFPPGVVIDSSKIKSPTTGAVVAQCGDGFYDGSAGTFKASVNIYNTTGMSVSLSNDVNSGNQMASGFSSLGNTSVAFSFNCRAPVLGWSSGTEISSEASSRIVSASYTTASGTSDSSNPLNFTAKVWDTHSAVTTGAAWKFTAPVAGYYKVNTNANVSGVGLTLYLYKNGSQSGIMLDIVPGNSFSASTVVQLVAGDYIDLRTVGGTGTPSGSSSLGVQIDRLSGPVQIAASESIVSRYGSGSGQSVSNNTLTIIDFATKEKDSHGAVTTGGSWKEVVPVAGEYLVCAALRFSSTTTASNYVMAIYKNGSSLRILNDTSAGAVAAGSAPGIVGCSTESLVAGDEINIRAIQSSGGSLALIGDTKYNYVSILKVGN